MTDKSVAIEILRQLGGQGRLKAMIGAKHFITNGDDLSFQFTASRVFNAIQITLTPMDTYTVRLFKTRKFSIVRETTFEGVYCDQLKGLIESQTGLRLSLF